MKKKIITESLTASITAGVAVVSAVASLADNIHKVDTGATKSLLSAKSKSTFVYPILADNSIPRETLSIIRNMVSSKYAISILSVMEQIIYDGRTVSSAEYKKSVMGRTSDNPDLKTLLGYLTRVSDNASDALEKFGKFEKTLEANNIFREMSYKIKNSDETGDIVNTVYATAITENNNITMGDKASDDIRVEVGLKHKTTEGNINTVKSTVVLATPLYTKDFLELKNVIGKSFTRPMTINDRWLKFKKDKEYKFITGFLLDIKALKKEAKDKAVQSELSNLISRLDGKSSLPYITYVLSEELFQAILNVHNIHDELEIFRILPNISAISMIVVGTDSIKIYDDGSRTPIEYMLGEVTGQVHSMNKELNDIVKRSRISY